jgi:hypothetical protein
MRTVGPATAMEPAVVPAGEDLAAVQSPDADSAAM